MLPFPLWDSSVHTLALWGVWSFGHVVTVCAKVHEVTTDAGLSTRVSVLTSA